MSDGTVLVGIPDLSEPCRGVRENLSPRVVFADEYKQLYEATPQGAHSPKNPRYKWESEQLYDHTLSLVDAAEAGKRDPDASEEWNQ
jgi:hypothetical protein